MRILPTFNAVPRPEVARPGAPLPAPLAPFGGPVDVGQFGPVAAPAPASIAELEARARLAEEATQSLARTLPETSDAQALASRTTELGARFTRWQRDVQALMRAGAITSPVVKSFARAVQQAALVQANLPPTAATLSGKAYARAALDIIANVSVTQKGQTAEGVAAENPLLLVPPLLSVPTLAAARARGVPTTTVEIAGAPAEVRRDVVMVFCPGVARTTDEFGPQQAMALKAGFASVLAETGNFLNADVNAAQVADAVARAKTLVSNPDAEVLLVGYSQGNTNLFEFMRDPSGKYAALRDDVRAIHCMHSAAGGSQLADLGSALGDQVTYDEHLTPEQRRLVRAYYRAKAQMLGLDPRVAVVNEKLVAVLATGLAALRLALRPVRAVFRAAGLGALWERTKRRLVQGLGMEAYLTALTDLGPSKLDVSKRLGPVFKQLTYGYERAVLLNRDVGGLFSLYLGGGLSSLTTAYGQRMLADPQLKAHLEGVPILNSVGEIPAAREQELVPPSQRLAYRFYEQLGLSSDYQVATRNQRLGRLLPTAIDLPPQAVGHWGVAGVLIDGDHTAANFSRFSPQGLTASALATFAGLGVL